GHDRHRRVMLLLAGAAVLWAIAGAMVIAANIWIERRPRAEPRWHATRTFTVVALFLAYLGATQVIGALALPLLLSEWISLSPDMAKLVGVIGFGLSTWAGVVGLQAAGNAMRAYWGLPVKAVSWLPSTPEDDGAIETGAD